MTDPLEINDDGTALQVRGELDMEASPLLLQAVRDRLKTRSPVVIDLRGVSYVDSSGIAVLVQGFKLAHKQSLDYVIRDPSPQVMSVLELSHLQDFFVIDASSDTP